ncbi:prolipoprotein diacylglyceryl transferase [Desulfatibacillum aliphaticivorans]|uniref:Phosphatidylglycerol--prolipoprotein diacylglyceryl transferase n=1 Tax=Desulfatibacillum aliphaticivorans TaxID=218208 RepID=B8FFR0_DESAL|nr:prolipoprotein diacylglyceryl transferase [Desulfatibacillum aliphaticivorans]ACL03465.1 prolipoprotein diacylglyceryl transferase [Desulfatibacillum aliphaticivorans]
MHPVLIQIGPLTLHSYGFMIAVGFLLGMFLASREARLQNEDPERIMDLCFYLVLIGALASRVPYVIFNWHEFAGNPLDILKIWKGGLVFYGGFIGALGVFAYFVKKYSMDAWKTIDILAPSVALGHAFGRIGCFFAGCCYGRPTDLPWAVTFTNQQCLAPLNTPLHPTQLYSSLGLFCIFALLFFIVRPRKTFHGQVFWIYILVYAIFRFCIEFLRGDDRGAYFLGLLSPSQTAAVALVVLAVVFLLKLRKRKIA